MRTATGPVVLIVMATRQRGWRILGGPLMQRLSSSRQHDICVTAAIKKPRLCSSHTSVLEHIQLTI
jgi:hypothetical protein